MAHLAANNTTSSFDVTDQRIPSPLLITYSVILCGIMVASLVVNAICFVLFLKNRELLINPSNKFLFNYIITSFGQSLLLMPVTLTSLVSEEWVFGDMLCQFIGIISVSLPIAALLALGSIAFDRYHFIVNPLTYPINMTSFKVNVIIFFIWFVSIISGLMPLFGWGHYEYNPHYMVCTVNWTNANNFGLYFAVIGYLIPLTLQLFCYCSIVKVAKKHATFGRRMSRVAIVPLQVARIIRETSASKTIRKTLIVLGVFIITWTPNVIMILVLTFINKLNSASSITMGLNLLVFVSSFIYPLLFVFRARSLKNEVRLLLSQSRWFTCINQVEPVDLPVPTDKERRKSSLSLDSYDFNTRRRSSKVSRVSWAMPVVIEDGIEPSAEPRSSLTGSTITTDVGSLNTVGSLLPGEIDCNNSSFQTRRKTKILRL